METTVSSSSNNTQIGCKLDHTKRRKQQPHKERMNAAFAKPTYFGIGRRKWIILAMLFWSLMV